MRVSLHRHLIYQKDTCMMHLSSWKNYLPSNFQCNSIISYFPMLVTTTNATSFVFCAALKLNLTVPVSSVEVKLFPRYNGVNYASASAGILPETGSALVSDFKMWRITSICYTYTSFLSELFHICFFFFLTCRQRTIAWRNKLDFSRKLWKNS